MKDGKPCWEFIERIHPYTEIALNGNDLTHPELEDFLKYLKSKKAIPNMTVNQKHFMRHYDKLKRWSDEGLIYGLGISLVNSNDKNFLRKAEFFPNSVIHVINGIVTPDDWNNMDGHKLKFLILGYKNLQRGIQYLDDNFEDIRANQEDLQYNLRAIVKTFPVVSFDNLAIEQLNVKKILFRNNDKEWNEFLRELVGSIVIRAVGHDSRHAVCVMEGTHKVVATGLGCRVGAMGVVLGSLYEEVLAIGLVVLRRRLGREGWGDTLWVSHLECTIHLVGRDMVEAFALILLRQSLPIEFGCLQERECAHHIGASECEWVLDRTIHMTLGCEVNDTRHVLLLHEGIHGVKIADVGFHKAIVGFILNILEVSQVARISQFVHIDNAILRVLVDEQSYYVAANKACATCDDNRFHIVSI